MPATFDLQGHRGARGLKPENTLPSFEVAFDLGVTSVETDLRLTRDGIPVLAHDPRISATVLGSSEPGPASPRPFISRLTLAELHRYRADRNPDSRRFPRQDTGVNPLAQAFAEAQDIDPFTPPTLAQLFAFAEAYAGPEGHAAGKTDVQRSRARRVRFDLELKRVPFRPELIGDTFDGNPSVLEQRVVECVRAAGVPARTSVRSFDHRCVRALRQLAPDIPAAVLIDGTVPVNPVSLARDAGAEVYCPAFDFLDEGLVRQLHHGGIRVVPWTVNEPGDWERLLQWGVDGITTDEPDRLAAFLQERGIAF